MDEVMDDVAAAAVEMVEDGVGAATASVEEEFDSFVKGKMEELVAAKAEYQELLGGEKPSFAELQDFVKLKKKVASEGRSKFKMADPDAPKEPFKPPSITCYPYSDWGDRPSVIVCPPTAMCPGYFSCPIKVKCCFPLTIIPGIGRCATKVGRLVGCPEYNPCCVATILLKPILAPLGTPCCIIHPCKMKCCKCGTCKCPSCCTLKTIGCDTPCCHCTFACCPGCCCTPGCQPNTISPEKKVSKGEGGAPDMVTMDRNA